MPRCSIYNLTKFKIKHLINIILKTFLSILIRYLINICSQPQHCVNVAGVKETRFTNWIKQVRPIASDAVLARYEENQIG